MNAGGGRITEEDRQAMVSAMLVLHGEIQTEIDKEVIDPARLMRLQGAALNQCLIALAHLLSPNGLPASDDSSEDS